MQRATVTQCAVLVGGHESRLGSLTTTTPTPLLPCGDRPFLAWRLREFVRFGVTEFLLLTGQMSDQVAVLADMLAAGLPRQASIALVEAPFRAGTGGTVFHARDRLDQRFLLCSGNSLLDCNLANLLAEAAADGDDVIGRSVLRRPEDASRHDVVGLQGDHVTTFLEHSPPGSSGVVSGGIHLFRRHLIEHLAPSCSLERDVMPRLAAAGALRGSVADGYFRDIGVPEDFARVQTEIPRLLRRRALFLDRDGVLNLDHGHVGTRDRFTWMPGALQAIRHATQAGWHVFVVTNQSGVARGFYDEAAVQDLLNWMEDAARHHGGTIDDYRYCPFHEQAAVAAYRRASDWRKPAPGMLLDLIRAWELDPARCLMIGDQATDIAAATAAGVPGHLFPGGNLLDFVRPLIG